MTNLDQNTATSAPSSAAEYSASNLNMNVEKYKNTSNHLDHSSDALNGKTAKKLRVAPVSFVLSDEQWALIRSVCPGKPGDSGAIGRDNRLFVEAVLWIVRTGSPWRDLPAQFGNWDSAYMRFSRWSKKGVWEKLAAALESAPTIQELFVKLVVARAQQLVMAAAKKSGVKNQFDGFSGHA